MIKQPPIPMSELAAHPHWLMNGMIHSQKQFMDIGWTVEQLMIHGIKVRPKAEAPTIKNVLSSDTASRILSLAKRGEMLGWAYHNLRVLLEELK